MNNASAASPDLFVAPATTSPPGRWLRVVRHLQDMLLFLWLASMVFLPSSLGSIAALLGLSGLWACLTAVSIWHIIKRPGTRREAAWVIAAPPLALLLMLVLHNSVGLPLTDAPQGEWLFYGSLSLFPLYWLARWLLRTTSPKQDSPVRMRLSALIILAIACMLMLQAIFLIWAILSGNDFGSFRELFGSDWFASLLQVTLGTAVIFAIGAVPYALLGLFRGTGHRGAMLGILLCTSVALACAFGALAVIAMLSIG